MPPLYLTEIDGIFSEVREFLNNQKRQEEERDARSLAFRGSVIEYREYWITLLNKRDKVLRFVYNKLSKRGKANFDLKLYSTEFRLATRTTTAIGFLPYNHKYTLLEIDHALSRALSDQGYMFYKVMMATHDLVDWIHP